MTLTLVRVRAIAQTVYEREVQNEVLAVAAVEVSSEECWKMVGRGGRRQH